LQSATAHSGSESYEDDEDADSHTWCIAPSSSCVLSLLLPNNALRDPEEHGGGWQ